MGVGVSKKVVETVNIQIPKAGEFLFENIDGNKVIFITTHT